MRTVVIHGRVHSGSGPDEQDLLREVNAVSLSLEALGHSVQRMEFTLDLEMMRWELDRLRPELVFNLVDSVEGKGCLIALAPLVLESLRIPFTGSGSGPIFVTSHKPTAKRMMFLCGVPTPKWMESKEFLSGCRLSDIVLIVKHAWEHASIGICDQSVIQSGEDAEGRLLNAFSGEEPPLFAEEYIEGREFNISLLDFGNGLKPLPASEIRFLDFPEGKPSVLGYSAKWDETSFEYQHSIRSHDFSTEDEGLLGRIYEMARLCGELFHIRGYGRIDFRVGPGEIPWVLEVNANPCLSPDAGFPAAARQAGIEYTELIEWIVSSAFI